MNETIREIWMWIGLVFCLTIVLPFLTAWSTQVYIDYKISRLNDTINTLNNRMDIAMENTCETDCIIANYLANTSYNFTYGECLSYCVEAR